MISTSVHMLLTELKSVRHISMVQHFYSAIYLALCVKMPRQFIKRRRRQFFSPRRKCKHWSCRML